MLLPTYLEITCFSFLFLPWSQGKNCATHCYQRTFDHKTSMCTSFRLRLFVLAGELGCVFAWLGAMSCFFSFCNRPGNTMWGKTISLQADSSTDPGQRLSPSCHKQRKTSDKWGATTRPERVQAVLQQSCSHGCKKYMAWLLSIACIALYTLLVFH